MTLVNDNISSSISVEDIEFLTDSQEVEMLSLFRMLDENAQKEYLKILISME